MTSENLKKFLDSAGVSHLWTKINNKIDDKISQEAERVNSKIGDIGDKSVKEYVDEKASNIDNETIKEIQDDVKEAEGRLEAAEDKISTIEKDYVKSNDIANFETKEKVKKISDALSIYQSDNDKALAEVKATANAAAEKSYVDKQLEGKANQSEFVEIQTLVNHFFAEEADVTAKLDQLVEIVEYLNSLDGDIGGEIVEDLANLQSKVNNLLDMGKDENDTEYTVTGYVEKAISDKLDIGNKSTVKAYIEGLLGSLDGKTVSGYVDDAIYAFTNGSYQDTLTAITKLGERIGAVEKTIEEIQEILDSGFLTTEYLEGYIDERLGLTKNDQGEFISVVDYINALALTNEEINVAIGATQQTN